jgi:CPA2 family monovalent cation:H+ antiporter-2
VLATLLIIVVGKSLAAYAIVRAFGFSNATALTISASLAQIGEFSFILANLGVALMLLPEQGRDLILAGAIISILLNPFMFSALDRLLHQREKAAAQAATATAEQPATREQLRPTDLTNHVVLVGHGRVGRVVSRLMAERGVPVFVIEDDEDAVAELKARGIAALAGNAADPDMITAANLRAARCLLVAIPDAFEGGQVVQQARAINPALRIVARAHSDAEILHLMKHGASLVVMGEYEIAVAMANHVT